jgi:FixJ family two-component response regulator
MRAGHVIKTPKSPFSHVLLGHKMPEPRHLVTVVDDEESVCKAVRRLIMAWGMRAQTLSSGQALLDSFAAERPDCVLLDLHMPGLSGMDVLRALAGAGESVPVIVITGRDEPASRALCLSAGAVAYMTKPLDHWKLLKTIEEAVGAVPTRP